MPLQVAEVADLTPSGETLITWPELRDHPFHGRLLRDGDRYAFWASDVGWFLVDPRAPSIGIEAGTGDSLRRELRLFGVPTALCVLERGDLSIHAAAVEIDGHGVLLAGPSKFGKTTLAAAFARAGHRLLSEDTTTCTTRGGPALFPGPAAVRLRRDVAVDIGPIGRIVAEDQGDRVRTVLDPATRGDGSPVPLRAILLLRDVTTTPELAPVPVASAIRDVWALTFMLPTDASQSSCFERITDLVSGVETLDLRRPLTMQDLPTVVSLVERRIRAG
jgi:Serine kinase of the HPr protein, regulates carbohydrate metabolism